MAQGGEHLGVCVDEAWVYGVAVSGAVRMAEDESSVGLARDEQLAAMDGAVVSSAESQKVGCLVATAFRASLNMMHVDERRVGAAGSAATAPIAREHGAKQSWGDALFGAWARTGVGACGSLLQVLVGGAGGLFGNGRFLSRARRAHVDVA